MSGMLGTKIHFIIVFFTITYIICFSSLNTSKEI